MDGIGVGSSSSSTRSASASRLVAAPPAGFVPVRMVAPPSAAGLERLVNLGPAMETIEVVLPDGSRLRVGNEVGLVALRRVLTALRG
jgi:transposase